ncbi:putative hydroxypyruvate isomerase [Amblyomma americanum]
MSLKFAANISTTYQIAPFLKRYRVAREAGFRAVECEFPYEVGVDSIRKAKLDNRMKHVLISSHPGDLTKGELGFAAIPGCESQFLTSLETSIKYAKALDCKKIHILAGITGPERSTAMEETYLTNLKMAAKLLEKEGIVGVIGPMCKEVQPGYFLDSFKQAESYINHVNHENIRLLLNIFHLQMISGNLINTMEALSPLVGHMQISQAPHRNEPGASGEINYWYILMRIGVMPYNDYIGLDYIPPEGTQDATYWISRFGYSCR